MLILRGALILKYRSSLSDSLKSFSGFDSVMLTQIGCIEAVLKWF